MALRLFEEQLVQFLVENVSFTYISWHFPLLRNNFQQLALKLRFLISELLSLWVNSY